MIKLATKFVAEKQRVHGDEWVVLFADNLSAHLNPEVKRIFGESRVLVIYFPTAMTEMVQPIDAGYGRSMRSAIGRELDLWLMNGDNLLKWEGKMTAMERRILVTHLVARAQTYMLHEDRDRQRISCFERTGCLITTEVCGKDVLIKPQGVTVSFIVPVIPPAEDTIEEEVIEEVLPQEEGDRANELARISAIFDECEIEEQELILESDQDVHEETV